MFSRWKTKPRAGRKCCSCLTPATAPKSPPFISMWPLQSPQPGKYLPALAWPGPVGGEKNLVLNVTALRARDVSRRQETPGPGSAARPCHGNSPARGGGWGGSARVKAMEVLGSRVLLLPGAGPFPSWCWMGSLSHNLSHFNSQLSPGPKTRENYMVLPWDGGFDPGRNSPKVTAPCSPSQSLSLRAAPPASSPSWTGTHRKGWK